MCELNLQLQQKIQYIETESEKRLFAREEKEEKRNKRKNAVQAPIRETINEFLFIYGLVKGSNFVGGRKKSGMMNVFNWIKGF